MLGIVAAVVTVAIIEIGRRTSQIVSKRPFVSYPLAAVVVALLAIGFSQITDQSAGLVLFSGQEAMNAVVQQAGTLALGTLVLIVIFKGLGVGRVAGWRTWRPDLACDLHRDRCGTARLALAGP